MYKILKKITSLPASPLSLEEWSDIHRLIHDLNINHSAAFRREIKNSTSVLSETKIQYVVKTMNSWYQIANEFFKWEQTARELYYKHSHDNANDPEVLLLLIECLPDTPEKLMVLQAKLKDGLRILGKSPQAVAIQMLFNAVCQKRFEVFNYETDSQERDILLTARELLHQDFILEMRVVLNSYQAHLIQFFEKKLQFLGPDTYARYFKSEFAIEKFSSKAALFEAIYVEKQAIETGFNQVVHFYCNEWAIFEDCHPRVLYLQALDNKVITFSRDSMLKQLSEPEKKQLSLAKMPEVTNAEGFNILKAEENPDLFARVMKSCHYQFPHPLWHHALLGPLIEKIYTKCIFIKDMLVTLDREEITNEEILRELSEKVNCCQIELCHPVEERDTNLGLFSPVLNEQLFLDTLLGCSKQIQKELIEKNDIKEGSLRL